MLNYCARMGVMPTGKNEDPSRLIDWFDDEKDLGYGAEATNDFRFLSNFWPDEPFETGLYVGRLSWKPREYMTGEHAFQAAKATNPNDFNLVADAKHPQDAKHYGRTITLTHEWDVVKYDVMRQVLNAKFALGTKAAELLLATGDALLVEGTWWNDQVWGVDLRNNAIGSNWLGVLLMSRRQELRWLS